jgi:hypothetical protein
MYDSTKKLSGQEHREYGMGEARRSKADVGWGSVVMGGGGRRVKKKTEQKPGLAKRQTRGK